MDNRRALPTRRDMFLDERGAGLRVTWHPERDLVVLSVWHDDSCVGTFRMPVQDVPRLSGLLAASLGDWVDQVGGGPQPAMGSGSQPVAGPEWPGVSGLESAGATGPESAVAAGPESAGATGPESAGAAGPDPAGASGPGFRPASGPGSADSAGGPLASWVGGGAGLSLQRRLRLSRPVLRLRGLQHRRRRSR